MCEVGVTSHTSHLKLDHIFFFESYPFSHGVIMGMYQVDTSPENVTLDDDEEEERMSAWVNSLTI